MSIAMNRSLVRGSSSRLPLSGQFKDRRSPRIFRKLLHIVQSIVSSRPLGTMDLERPIRLNGFRKPSFASIGSNSCLSPLDRPFQSAV
jgi:hypothetical protein